MQNKKKTSNFSGRVSKFTECTQSRHGFSIGEVTKSHPERRRLSGDPASTLLNAIQDKIRDKIHDKIQNL